MRGVLVEVPESLLAERRRLGVDRFDEMWGGELHMVPPPSNEHQRIGRDIVLVLAPLAEEAGLSLLPRDRSLLPTERRLCPLDVSYAGVVYFRNNGSYHSRAYSLNNVKNVDNG